MQSFDYFLQPHPQDPHYLARSTIVAALAKLAPTVQGTLLDVGSGQFRGYEGLFQPYVRQYLCVDRQYADTVDICADCYDIPLENDSIDAILSTQVLEHLQMPDRMLAEAYRLLKPGGQLILTVPMVWGLHEEPVDYYRYTQYGLEYLLKQTGYEQIQIQPLEGVFAVLIQMLLDEFYASWLKKAPRIAPWMIGQLNRLALAFDRRFPTRRLCLTYLVTAQKAAPPIGR